jgi:hypothetical protein
MDRVRCKKQGDEERKKVMVVPEKPPQDLEQQQYADQVKHDIKKMAYMRVFPEELVFNGKRGTDEWPVAVTFFILG